MANSFLTDPIYIDSFSTSAMDFSDTWPNGLFINAIEWVGPAGTGDTCLIRAQSSEGPPICDWTCESAFKNQRQEFYGKCLDLYIGKNKVDSGYLLIHRV